jgi:hypothetical protein
MRKKLSEANKKNIKNNTHTFVQKSTCRVCGVTMQHNMILRWHNEKCQLVANTWSYISPKLRGRPWK